MYNLKYVYGFSVSKSINIGVAIGYQLDIDRYRDTLKSIMQYFFQYH